VWFVAGVNCSVVVAIVRNKCGLMATRSVERVVSVISSLIENSAIAAPLNQSHRAPPPTPTRSQFSKSIVEVTMSTDRSPRLSHRSRRRLAHWFSTS
jgi:hypothetical protein